MLRGDPITLHDSLIAAGALSSRVFADGGASASWDELAAGYGCNDWAAELRGCSVLLTGTDPFAAAAALIQLDGVARRIVLYPSDVSRKHLKFVAGSAAADVVVTDPPKHNPLGLQCQRISPGGGKITTGACDRSSRIETEWVLLTSGTTGIPKLVAHTLRSLTGAILRGDHPADAIVWSTFYDIRRYGGLQIFLRAALTGTRLLLVGAQEARTDFLSRAGAHGVTNVSGTPSHWRRALMSPAAGRIKPAYVRLSGEIADQTILNHLRSQYPQARIAHAFASTEAGVAFEVNDGLAGFPTNVIGGTPDVEMKVEDGTLRVRSNRTASRYLSGDSQLWKDAEGFVDTGDVLELRDGRYHYAGRRDGAINVGGLKVHPEEVEVVINRHPEVSMSLVRARNNPVTGMLVVADVVLKTAQSPVEKGAGVLQRDILEFCRAELALHKVPAAIHFVPILAMAETGKLIRRRA